jgi:hypothetical protein
VRIIVRGDSGFGRQRLIRGCERNDVGDLIGVAKNARLEKIVKPWEDKLEQQYPGGTGLHAHARTQAPGAQGYGTGYGHLCHDPRKAPEVRRQRHS